MFQKEVCFWPYRKTSAAIFQVVSDTKYAIFETMKSEQAFLTYFVPLFLDNASLHNISKKSVSTSVSLPKKKSMDALHFTCNHGQIEAVFTLQHPNI